MVVVESYMEVYKYGVILLKVICVYVFNIFYWDNIDLFEEILLWRGIIYCINGIVV